MLLSSTEASSWSISLATAPMSSISASCSSMVTCHTFATDLHMTSVAVTADFLFRDEGHIWCPVHAGQVYANSGLHKVLKATLENLSEAGNAFSPPGGMVARWAHVGHSTSSLQRDIRTRLSKQSRQMEWRQGRTTGSSIYSALLPHSLHSKNFCRVPGRGRLVAMLTAAVSSICKLRLMNTACRSFSAFAPGFLLDNLMQVQYCRPP